MTVCNFASATKTSKGSSRNRERICSGALCTFWADSRPQGAIRSQIYHGNAVCGMLSWQTQWETSLARLARFRLNPT